MRQKEQILVITFSQQIAMEYQLDVRNQREHPGCNNEQSIPLLCAQREQYVQNPHGLYFLDLKRPLIVRCTTNLATVAIRNVHKKGFIGIQQYFRQGREQLVPSKT